MRTNPAPEMRAVLARERLRVGLEENEGDGEAEAPKAERLISIV